jgi:putative membrane protein
LLTGTGGTAARFAGTKWEIGMRFGALVLAAALPFALAACGQSETATTAEANDATSANEVASANDSSPVAASGAQAFVNTVAASDRFEIETSKLVPSSAASAQVMDFAKQLIAAHTASTAKLKAIAAKDPSGIVIDDQLSTAQQATLEDMKSKKGYIFDAAYLAALTYGHDQALTELKDYAESGDNPALKEFAAGMIPTVTEHLEKARTLTGKIGPHAQ